jgi:flagellar FliL protein
MTAVRGAAKKQAAPVQAPVAPPAPEKKKMDPKILAIGGVVLLALVYFMFLKPKPAANDAAPPTAAGAPITAGNVKLGDLENIPHDGPVVALSSITVNLADGKFLRVGVALQLGKAGSSDGTIDPPSYGARALDSTISVMSTYTATDLTDAKGRLKAKERLARTIVARYGGDVLGIYFTDFVMQ